MKYYKLSTAFEELHAYISDALDDEPTAMKQKLASAAPLLREISRIAWKMHSYKDPKNIPSPLIDTLFNLTSKLASPRAFLEAFRS